MIERPANPLPPDRSQRDLALDPRRSVLVRAPAGSGKTTLLAERFLCLLAEVDEPGHVVAITFTNAAAAEMRNRVLDELRNDRPGRIARRALQHSIDLGWNLLDLPSQLRISTIDSFCRDLAFEQPLLSGLGGSLEIAEQPTELYRRAARRTIEHIGGANAALSAAIETLLRWRDNNWQDLESLTVEMLGSRDRWMQDFVFVPQGIEDWNRLRARLERPFLRACGQSSAIRYTDEEWRIVRACFTLLRRAAAELRVVFAEAAATDFTEVAQIALNVLKGESGAPSDSALAVADSIRHLLVDEFQDTSRRQHQLLAHLIAAWPERNGRTCFVVGDPMQSIYFFRDADAELFPRVAKLGLEIPKDLPFFFESVHLTTNFRTVPPLLERLNEIFTGIFAIDDGSGVTFTHSGPPQTTNSQTGPRLVVESSPPFQLHLEFMPDSPRGNSLSSTPERSVAIAAERESACQKQIDEIVSLVRSHLPPIHQSPTENANNTLGDERKKFRIAILARTHKSLVPIARALREAAIPFRAVELEKLQDRPEIVDALALVRALLNPHDRVAWLGVLRAPWCGLSLADLHALTSAGNNDLLTRPVPDLLYERSALLAGDRRLSVDRVLRAIDFAARLRSIDPTASPGTWLEQVWVHLGGPQCVDAAARVNLELLWSTLDSLPQGEPDLLGPALDAALAMLTAQPGPGDCAVQLMTIHKSKGLEFEMVVVPDLQAVPRRTTPTMLSWLERGLSPGPDLNQLDEPASEITEFLIAPFQPKGAGCGAAKKFVDRARSDREKQESRRLLYVAATRARNELHFFARPSYKTAPDGFLTLCDPAESLLKVAWPAFENEIRARFESWRAVAAPAPQPATLESLAAQASTTFSEAAFGAAPVLLRRLPADFQPSLVAAYAGSAASPLLGAGQLYRRHEGGLAARALGVAVHSLLHHLAKLFAAQPFETARASLALSRPSIVAGIRAAGFDLPQADRLATQAIQIALQAASHPVGQWILFPHSQAASEIRWTGVVAGSLRTVQADRVFLAGTAPQSAVVLSGDTAWWIIDYKTAHPEGLSPEIALSQLRRTFSPQIDAYARILRSLHGPTALVCCGLYYPRISLFDWWRL